MLVHLYQRHNKVTTITKVMQKVASKIHINTYKSGFKIGLK